VHSAYYADAIVHPTDPFAEAREPDDHTYMLDPLLREAIQLRETMATKTGRALAQQRRTSCTLPDQSGGVELMSPALL